MPIQFGALGFGIGLVERPDRAINDAPLQVRKIVLLREMGRRGQVKTSP